MFGDSHRLFCNISQKLQCRGKDYTNAEEKITLTTIVSIFQSEDERGMSKSGAWASAPMKSAYVSMCFKVEVFRLAVHKFIIPV